MQVSLTERALGTLDCDALLVTFTGGELPSSLKTLDETMGGQISRLMKAGRLSAERGAMSEIFTPEDVGPVRVVLLGLGEQELDPVQLRDACADALRGLSCRGMERIAVDLSEVQSQARALVEGLLLGAYRFRGYADEQKPGVNSLLLGSVDGSPLPGSVEEAVRQGEISGRAVIVARDLVNEPGNRLTPSVFAERASDMASERDLSCTVFDEHDLKEMGMGLLLGVSAGSAEPPRLIELRYECGHDAPTLVLAGKGLTFDSGGISLKSRENMGAMKMDMGGGAAVFGAMQVLADLRPGMNVVGLICASENLPDGRAQKPGDVVQACNGMTVEIISTDAEGRLVLADVLADAVGRLSPDWIVDVATLTGSASVALGDQAAALVSDNDDLAGAIERAAAASGERVWRLPAYSEYAEALKSDVADLKNSGGKTAGTIKGGLFIRAFAGGLPWAHLDIAGVAWTDRDKGINSKGGTGYAVRTLAALPDAMMT